MRKDFQRNSNNNKKLITLEKKCSPEMVHFWGQGLSLMRPSKQKENLYTCKEPIKNTI